jgi:hypothetical protein
VPRPVEADVRSHSFPVEIAKMTASDTSGPDSVRPDFRSSIDEGAIGNLNNPRWEPL